MRSRRLGGSLLSGAPLFAALTIVLYHLRSFLTLDQLPLRGDPLLSYGSDLTPQFAIFARVAIMALWDQGKLAFWNPFVLAGAPLFEAPQAGVISFATLLGGLFPAEGAITLSMIAHVLLGMLGVFGFARQLKIEGHFAACGALAFGLGTFLIDHFRVGHLNQVYPMALALWVFHLAWRALASERNWHRSAIACGAVVGAQILEGGDSVLLYEALALVSLPGCAPFGADRFRFLRRAVSAGLLIGAAALAISACQLLPMLSYLPLTGRAGGLPLEAALDHVQEVKNPVPGLVYLLLCVLGALMLWRSADRRVAVWLAWVVALGFATATIDPLFTLFWRIVPGFRYQGIPQRALVLVAVAGPVLVAAGMQFLSDVCERWRSSRFWRALPVGAAAMLVFVSLWREAPEMPPMVSPREEMAANHAMQWLKAHAQGSRIHIVETIDRHWGTEHVTMPLGLEVIAGYVPSDNRDYLPFDFEQRGHRGFFPESYRDPAKMWGLLNVRYVLSTVPREIPGFRLAAIVPHCPIEICQPQKSAGPFIYENGRWLPRAYLVRHAIALVGPASETFEAALDILLSPIFDPARAVILQVPPGAPIPPVDVAVAVGSEVPRLPLWGSREADGAVMKALKAIKQSAVQPVDWSRPDVNHLNVRASSAGWLVVSERIGLFPGWSAHTDGKPATIYRANGVLGAMLVRGDTNVTLEYEPQGFMTGLLVLLVGASLWCGAEVWMCRRARQKPTS